MAKLSDLRRMNLYRGLLIRGVCGRVLAGVLLGVLVYGCNGAPESGKQRVATRVKEPLARYRDDTISLDEGAKWFTLFGDRSALPPENSNETQWVVKLVHSRAVERSLSEQAKQLGLEQQEEMLKRRQAYTDEGLTRLYYLENVVAPIKITEEEIERYYREHQSDFHQPERFSLRMIFFDPEKGGQENARRRALEVMDRIEKGAEFDSLIVEYSDIEEADRMKVFGPYSPGEGLLAAIEEVALSLKVGQVSEIIEHQKGFHIIKLVQRREARDTPLEEVREKIHERLFDQKAVLAEEQIERSQAQTLEIQKNYHILGLPITATNDVVLQIADEVMTYGDYLDMVRTGNYNSEEEFNLDFQRRYRSMLYLALARREGYSERPALQEWVGLQMDRELTFALLKQKVDAQVEVSEEEIQQEFEKHRALFNDPKMVYVRQIYLPIPTRAGMARYELIREIQDTKARAQQIVQHLLQGLSFEEAARLYSSDPSADTGGLLGWVAFGYSRRFDEVAFKMDEGEITLTPVARRRGFQLIKVEKKQDLRLKSLDEARGQIYDRLYRLKADEAREAFVAEAMENAQVELEPSTVTQLGPFLREFWDRDSIYTVSE